jgi:hypothetical protein
LPAAAVVVVAVVVEPPVLAVVVLARLPVLAPAQVVARRAPRPLWRRLPVLAKAHLPVRADLVVLARVPVVAHLVVAQAVALQLLLSRRLFSAAMARSSP